MHSKKLFLRCREIRKSRTLMIELSVKRTLVKYEIDPSSLDQYVHPDDVSRLERPCSGRRG